MPKKVDHAAARADIALAACRAIARKGVAGASLRDIASEAGVTTGMIANYFESRDAVLEAALQVPFRRIEDRIEAALATPDCDLSRILDGAIPSAPEHLDDVAVWVSFWGLIATDGALRGLNAELHDEGQHLFERAVMAAWPESREWSRVRRRAALRSITAMLFGLSAAGATGDAWPAEVQRAVLKRHLDDLRATELQRKGTRQAQ
jgi:AcrR family transcriptional regulator